MHLFRAPIAALSAVALIVLAASCGEKTTEPLGPQVHSITVAPNPATVRVDETLVMVVAMAADSGADKTLIWTSADPRRVSVSDNGILTGISVGPAVVTVQSAANPTLSAMIPVNVMPKYTGVRSIVISPAVISLLPGQTQAVSATVDADSKVSREVKFEIDSPTVATVTASGIVAAVKSGVAHLTARSVADPTVTAAIGVVVRTPNAARISIQALTAGGTTNPVNLDNVRGQIDAIVNVDQGELPITRINLVVTNNNRDTTVASMNYSAALTAARADVMRRARSASDSSLALNVVAPIVMSFRTNTFDATSGAVSFRNGATSIKAVAVTTGAGGTAQQEASGSTIAMLNNPDGFLMSVRGLTSTGIISALDPSGRRWIQAGRGIVFTTLPVMFSGKTVGARTLAFPAITPVATASSLVSGESVDTLTLPTNFATTTTGDGYINGELPSIIATDNTGSPLTLVPSIAGSSGGAGYGIINAQPGFLTVTRLDGIRIDNAPPPPAAFSISNAQQNTNNWINGAYKFSSGLSGLTADTGVGFFGSNVAPTPESAGVSYLVTGGTLADTTEAVTGSQLPATNTNTDYKVVARLTDRLGNSRLVPLSGTSAHPKATFGVDLTPPTPRYAFNGLTTETLISGGSDSVFSSLTGSSGPMAFAVDAIDDRSGLANGRIGITLTRFSQPNPVGAFTGTTTCVIGVNGVCGPVYVNYESVLPDLYRQYTVAMDGGTGIEGYYTFTATVQDQAGNVSAPITKQALFDAGVGASAPVLTGLGVSGVLTGGIDATFVALALDNVELARGGVLLEYPNLPGATHMLTTGTPAGGGTNIGIAFNASLTSPVAGVHNAFKFPSFIRGIESVSGANAPQAYPATTAKPIAMNGWVTDFSPASVPATLAVNAAIAPTAVQSPGATAGFAAAVGTINELSLWRRSGTSGSVFEAIGPTGQSVSPFVRVVLARLEPTGLTVNANAWRIVSELTAPVGQDNGQVRQWRYDFGTQNPGTYIAIGVNAAGDGIVTQIVTF